jgi:SAM-dependent methyltransferase
MRRFFQTEWQNIYFAENLKTNSNVLPDSDFYNKFYTLLFKKYSNYNSLSNSWRMLKGEISDWLQSNISDGDNILSIGCGIGYVEHKLWLRNKNKIDLHVHDYASDSLFWLRQIMPEKCIHDSVQSMELNLKSIKFDLIYLVAVDYALTNTELIKLFIKLKKSLKVDGRLLLVSASFLDESSILQLLNSVKSVIKFLLDKLGLYNRGQFWGWLRSSADYRIIMTSAGFKSIDQGFIHTQNQHSYWISGCN